MATVLTQGLTRPFMAKEIELVTEATAAKDGDAIDIGFLADNFSWQSTVTGSPTGFEISLQMSPDGGTTWIIIESSTTAAEIKHVAAEATLIRGVVKTLSGGSSPKVTIKCIAKTTRLI